MTAALRRVVRGARRRLIERNILVQIPRVWAQYLRFNRLSVKGASLRAGLKDVMFITGEATPTTEFDHHYVYHPAWAARVLAKTRPLSHVDISSTLHFCSMLSAFMPVRFYDYRPARLELDNLTSDVADLTKLPFQDNELSSLSCMHTVEHVGLGRYGDPIDPAGDLKAMAELRRVVSPRGSLLLVVPIGSPKVRFNAHRIYSYDDIVKRFEGMQLREFSLVTDPGFGRDFIENASEDDAEAQSYGCGCFWFIRQ